MTPDLEHTSDLSLSLSVTHTLTHQATMTFRSLRTLSVLLTAEIGLQYMI